MNDRWRDSESDQTIPPGRERETQPYLQIKMFHHTLHFLSDMDWLVGFVSLPLRSNTLFSHN